MATNRSKKPTENRVTASSRNYENRKNALKALEVAKEMEKLKNK